jgi:hypothetical protein
MIDPRPAFRPALRAAAFVLSRLVALAVAGFALMVAWGGWFHPVTATAGPLVVALMALRVARPLWAWGNFPRRAPRPGSPGSR